jgi:hypothetical protein
MRRELSTRTARTRLTLSSPRIVDHPLGLGLRSSVSLPPDWSFEPRLDGFPERRYLSAASDDQTIFTPRNGRIWNGSRRRGG